MLVKLEDFKKDVDNALNFIDINVSTPFPDTGHVNISALSSLSKAVTVSIILQTLYISIQQVASCIRPSISEHSDHTYQSGRRNAGIAALLMLLSSFVNSTPLRSFMERTC